MSTNKMIVKEQIKSIYAALARTGQREYKGDIVLSATKGRTSHVSALTFEEAQDLIQAFNSERTNDSSKMISKLFAMAHEMGWISEGMALNKQGKMEPRKDYSHLYQWVQIYGYKKKPLNKYTYVELPKLISQFEFNVYKNYLTKL